LFLFVEIIERRAMKQKNLIGTFNKGQIVLFSLSLSLSLTFLVVLASAIRSLSMVSCKTSERDVRLRLLDRTRRMDQAEQLLLQHATVT
jgi:hypothetical protein